MLQRLCVPYAHDMTVDVYEIEFLFSDFESLTLAGNNIDFLNSQENANEFPRETQAVYVLEKIISIA